MKKLEGSVNTKYDDDEDSSGTFLQRVQRVERGNNYIVFVIILLICNQLFLWGQIRFLLTTKDTALGGQDLNKYDKHSQSIDILGEHDMPKDAYFRTRSDTFVTKDMLEVTNVNERYALSSKKEVSRDSIRDTFGENLELNELLDIGKRQSEHGNKFKSILTRIKSNDEGDVSEMPLQYESEKDQILLIKSDIWKTSEKSRKSRNLQANQTTTSCNGNVFDLDLHLGENATDNSWDLKDKHGNILANQSYVLSDSFTAKEFTSCLLPDTYTFTLRDRSGNGFECDKSSVGCYTMFLDNQWFVRGQKFVGKEIVHTFDTSSPCISKNAVVFNLEQNFSSAISWSIQDTKSKKKINFEPFATNSDSNPKQSFFSCLSAGSYSYEIFSMTGEELSCGDMNHTQKCFDMMINDSVFITKNNTFSRINGYFFINKEGKGHEQACPLNPILAPLNTFNNHTYDENISNKLDLIYSLSSFDDVHNPRKPQYKAACWMIYDDRDDFSLLDDEWIERYAFSVFLYSMGQLAETLPEHICNYDTNRIECDDTGHLKTINFDESGNRGSMTPELSFFRKLERLILTNNNLKGSIPSSLGDLAHLKELSLDRNNLGGTLFPEIGNLINLEILSIDKNSLTGIIPSEIGLCAQLQTLKLDVNELEGPIPSQLYNLTDLFELSLFSNNLHGPLSTSMSNLMKLHIARLENNAFSGTIPTEVGKLPLLTFSLSTNNFSGRFPQTIGNMEKLQMLLLSNNKLTGTLSDTFENLTSIKTMDLSNNKLSGPIPPSLWSLENLKEINLKGNSFKGVAAIDNCTRYDVLGIDNSIWLDDKPMIECTCCVIEGCRVWESTGKASHRPCPTSNIHKIDFFNLYQVEDIHSRGIQSRTNFARFDQAEVCLSPTGCYRLSYREEPRVTVDYEMTYSSNKNELKMNGECDAVSICNDVFNSSDPRRILLNHITQTVDLDITNEKDVKYESLCWMLTEDQEKYPVCDGTLLQRYVIAAFYLSTGFKSDLYELNQTDTCQWPGITCDSSEKFVEVINLEEQELNGSIISELGYLTRLKEINLSKNKLDGTLDPRIMINLHNLEKFFIQENNMNGEIPKELFALPEIRELNAGDNEFDGTLPSSLRYSKKFEYINVANNILKGSIYSNMFAPPGLKFIDISENVLHGTIPPEIGQLKNLEVLKFSRNRLSGSIPEKIFKAKSIEKFLVQGNKLTGSIPTIIGNLQNATEIFMNHNALKSTIPSEISHIKNLMKLHLHSNMFTGTIPIITSSVEAFDFIADCQSVSGLVCASCTLCCDDDQECTAHNSDANPLHEQLLIYFFTIPIGFAILFFVMSRLIQACSYSVFKFDVNRDPRTICSDDSVYNYIFSNNPMAWFIHFLSYAVQIALYFVFLRASDPTAKQSLVSANSRCLEESDTCVIIRLAIEEIGWLLFFVMTLLYLGPEIIESFLQLRMAFIAPFDLRFLISGLTIMGLAIVSLTAAYFFNFATAATNTDLIMNAVILLFINDLDEQAMNVLVKLVPLWHDDREEEITDYMNKRQEKIVQREFLSGHGIQEESSNKNVENTL